jgi:acylphosphatase
MEEVAYRLEIRGRVQGVFYRGAMVDQARSLGVRGWVRNRLDGSVEAVVAGERDAVERIVAWARRGPRAALVTSVEVFPAEGSFGTFEQCPTA